MRSYMVILGTGNLPGGSTPLQTIPGLILVVLAALTALTTPSVAEAQGSQTGAVSDDSRVAAPPSGTAAVLPFSNVSGDPADDWLGAGIAETVSVDLKNLYGFSVVGREAVVEAARRVDDSVSDQRLVEIGRGLQADWVVTGAYQRLGDLIRITARLVDVESGSASRSVKVDGMLSEIFELQDQIVVGLGGGSAGQPADVTAGLDRSATGAGGARPGARQPLRGGTSAEASGGAVAVPGSEGIVVPPPPSSPEDRRPAALTPADVTGGLTLGDGSVDAFVPGRTTAAGSGIGNGAGVVPARVPAGPVIDGRLDDDAWSGAVRITDFVQMNPLDGAPASEPTEVYLAYDNNNFYVGVYAHYSDPTLMRANRVERDQTVRDDKLTVYFDPFMDQQRAYVFSVNGYGVQGDATLDSGGSRGGRRRQGGGRWRPQGRAAWDHPARRHILGCAVYIGRWPCRRRLDRGDGDSVQEPALSGAKQRAGASMGVSDRPQHRK